MPDALTDYHLWRWAIDDRLEHFRAQHDTLLYSDPCWQAFQKAARALHLPGVVPDVRVDVAKDALFGATMGEGVTLGVLLAEFSREMASDHTQTVSAGVA